MGLLGLLRRRRGFGLGKISTSRKLFGIICVFAFVVVAVAQTGCSRSGYYSIQKARLSIQYSDDLQIDAGAGQALKVQGLPVQSPEFEIYL